ncbi:phospholipid-binding protein [Spirochaetia bacterium]|nr:phospholipid-binding protein [Spirochaetia bacterium]
MAIITISRELAALGDETAVELSKRLNYRFVDKQCLEDRIKSYGVNGEKFEKYDERKPSFFASLSNDRDDYLHYLKSAMLAEAKDGNCVFIGRGSFAILGDLPGVIPVYLVSSEEVRVARIKSFFHCDEKHARQIITQSDQDRTGFHKYFFDIDWKDPHNYKLTFNTSYLHPAACSEVIENLVQHSVNAGDEIEFSARMKELCLAQSIIHHVLYEKQIAVHFLEASVSGNTASLFGVANSSSLSDAAVAAAKEVPSVETVHSEIQVVHEYSVMP